MSHTEIIYSHTDRTDLTDFYIPLIFNYLSRRTNGRRFRGSQMAEMAEILFSRRDAEGAEFYSNTD